MTVLSKLHCYGFELYNNDGQETAVVHFEFTLYLKLGYCKTRNSAGFHNWSLTFPHISPSVKSHSILIYKSSDSTDNRVSCIKNTATTSRTVIMAPFYSLTKGLK